MKRMVALVLLATLTGCASAPKEAAEAKVGWTWVIQYSYKQPRTEKDPAGETLKIKDDGYDRIQMCLYDDGRVEYLRDGLLGGNAAWHRELKKSRDDMAEARMRIEAILADTNAASSQPAEADRVLEAGIIVRTAKELVSAWGNNRFGGDPNEQSRKVFKNWRDLDDATHAKIQTSLKRFNDEAEKRPWKWN